VGTTWEFRLDCSAEGIHRPTVAGIHGSESEGCYSVCLSGGYEDDVDCGAWLRPVWTGSHSGVLTVCSVMGMVMSHHATRQVMRLRTRAKAAET
jgi:hypothetical protein